MDKIRIHNEGRYFCTGTDTPFFWMGDTAWELFHKLTQEETASYFDIRKSQGFNVIQCVLLAEQDGLRTPNAYGRSPLKKNVLGEYDPALPDTEGTNNYWDHVDTVLAMAQARGLYLAMLPTWGDKFNIESWGVGPVCFTPENARIYGKFLGERYKDYNNIVWILGGDRMLTSETHRDIIDAMATGLKEGGATQLISYHPGGSRSSVEAVGGKDYINFHAIQSGHDAGRYRSRELLVNTLEAEHKPYMNMEPKYEDHPACFRADYGYFWSAAEVRNDLYWNLLEGVCGHTYGNHCIWSFTREPGDYFPYHWESVLHHEAAEQQKYAVQLRLSRPFFEFRRAPELVQHDSAANADPTAARGNNYAFVYSPLGLPLRVYLNLLGDTYVRATWFDPRTGNTSTIGIYPPEECVMIPPTCGFGQDWILILDLLA